MLQLALPPFPPSHRRMKSPPAKIGKPRMPRQTTAKVRSPVPLPQPPPPPAPPWPHGAPARRRPGLLCLAEERAAGSRHREGAGPADRGPPAAAFHAREEGSVYGEPAASRLAAYTTPGHPAWPPHLFLPSSPWEPLNPMSPAKSLLSYCHEGSPGADLMCMVLSLGAAPGRCRSLFGSPQRWLGGWWLGGWRGVHWQVTVQRPWS